MAVNNTQGIVLAIFGANAGGHLSALDANATANGNASLATDLSAAAGLILGVDLSSDAAFTSTVLGNLGIAEDSAGYTLASNYFTTNLAAGAGRGDLVASAVDYLLGSNVDASLSDVASSFSASVTAGVEYSQGEGAAVFGVAALQAAAGNTATAGEGQTFELTSEDDSISGTAGSDTFISAAGTLSADDAVTDGSTTDNDVFNITASTAVAMDVSNVENININWDGFATPTWDLTDVSGATVTLSSQKAGYLGSANIDVSEGNNIVFGAGITGTADVDGADDATITATVAETLTIGVGAAGDEADGDMVVNAGAAETVTIEGGETITVTALSADTVTVTGDANKADTMTVNLGVDTDLTATGAADSVLNINSDADVTATLDAASRFETLNLGGAGDVELDINVTLANLATETVITNGGVVTLGGTLATKDLSGISHTELRIEDTTAAATLSLQGGANVVLEETIAGAITFKLENDYDTSNDVLNLSLEDEQDNGSGNIIVNGTSGENDFETVNLTILGDGNNYKSSTDFNITEITGDNAASNGSGTTVNLISTDDAIDVVIGGISAKTLDATGFAGELTVTQATDTDEDFTVIAGDQDTTANFNGTTVESTFVSGNDADDTVTFETTSGTAVAQFAGGSNSVTAEAIIAAAGTLAVVGGSGADTVTLFAESAGTHSLLLGDGDNVVDLKDLDDGAQINITAGDGDDEVTIDLASGEDIDGLIDLGEGENTLVLAAGADLSDVDGLTLENIDIIELTSLTAATDTADDAILNGALLDGATFTLIGSSSVDELGVEMASTVTSLDLSGITITDSVVTGIDGVNVSGGKSTGVTVTLTNGADEYTGTAGDDVVYGGAGNDVLNAAEGENIFYGGKGDDTLTGATSDDDQYVFEATASANGTDVLSNFEAGSAADADVLDFSAMLAGGALMSNPATPKATDDSDEFDATDKVVLFSLGTDDSGIAGTEEDDDLASAFDDASEVFALFGSSKPLSIDDDGKALIFIGADDASSPSLNTAVWLVDAGLTGTSALQSGDIKLVGNINNLEIGTLIADNFSF